MEFFEEDEIFLVPFDALGKDTQQKYPSFLRNGSLPNGVYAVVFRFVFVAQDDWVFVTGEEFGLLDREDGESGLFVRKITGSIGLKDSYRSYLVMSLQQ